MGEAIPVMLPSGILGAGKIISLQHIITSEHGHKIAVVVNDIGEINTGTNLIEKYVK